MLGEESLTFLRPSALEVSNYGGWKKSLRCPSSLADKWHTHLLCFIQTVAFKASTVSQSQFKGRKDFIWKFCFFSFIETSILIKIEKVALQLTGSVSSIILTQALTERPILPWLRAATKTQWGMEKLVFFSRRSSVQAASASVIKKECLGSSSWVKFLSCVSFYLTPSVRDEIQDLMNARLGNCSQFELHSQPSPGS